MNGVCHLDPAFVVGFAALGRKLLLLGAIQLDEGAGHSIAGHELVAGERLEQPPAHDLKALVGTGGPPGRFHAADGVFQPRQGFAAPLTADFDVRHAPFGFLVRAFGSWNTHDQQRVLGRLCRFTQRLGEGEVRLERSGGQIRRGVQLAGIGDPFVDQDQAGAILVEEFLQRIAGVGGVLVVLFDELVAFLAAELPGDFAPEGADDGPVGLLVRLARRNLRTDEDGAFYVLGNRDGEFFDQFLDAGQFARWSSGEHVIECQLGVGLAAAEVGLQLDDRIASLTGQPRYGLRQQPAQAFCQKRPAEELCGVLVLVGAFSLVNLPQVGCEFGLLIPARGHVRMRRDDFTPRLQTALGVAFGGLERFLAHLRAALFVENDPHEVHSHLADFSRGLGGRDRVEQPFRRIECPNGVVADELLVVRPLVADASQFTDQTAFGRSQHVAEDVIPLVPHDAEQDLWIIEIGALSLGFLASRRGRIGEHVSPLVTQVGFEFAFDKGAQASG